MKGRILIGVSITFLVSSYAISCENARIETKTEFVIIIPSYNNERWVDENLASACFQKSSLPYKVIFINDASTDKTGKHADTFVKDNNLETRVTIIHNEKNRGALENIYRTIHEQVPDDAVVVILDGDDFLLHNKVLLTLEKYYANSDIWMTHGSAINWPDKTPLVYNHDIPRKVIINNNIRQYKWCTSHLRTFRADLFKRIKKEDLLLNGKFFSVAGDMAIMIPMLEMCAPYAGKGPIHVKYIPEILYAYRTDNPISDFRIKAELQKKYSKVIRKMKKYEPIENIRLHSIPHQ